MANESHQNGLVHTPVLLFLAEDTRVESSPLVPGIYFLEFAKSLQQTGSKLYMVGGQDLLPIFHVRNSLSSEACKVDSAKDILISVIESRPLD